MKTKLEIIEETAAYYIEDPKRRAVNQVGGCYYYIDGRMCAVGRCLIEPNQKFEGTCNSLTRFDEKNYSHENVNLENVLKEEYRGHSVQFWRSLQRFHDREDHWYNNKLSKKGQEYLDWMKGIYKNN